MTWPPVRGHVVRADIGLAEPTLFVIVSNNRRNKNLGGQVLAARLTTTPKPLNPSIAALSQQDQFTGSVGFTGSVCDDIVEIRQDEVRGVLGALALASMTAASNGLRAALGLT